MLSFQSDYSTGAHPKVLHHLIDTNTEALVSYGDDLYSISAKNKILTECDCPDGSVYFLSGETQTNRIVISSMLRSFEGVVCADTGHIALHEAGAIESTGHKVITLPHVDGKLESRALADYLKSFYADANHEHMVFPGMVYISHPTEYGTLYTKEELCELSTICKEYSIPLYMDGARLGYALCSSAGDLTLPEIAKLCDVFYIGGTKMGALCGEAVVFTKANVPSHFMTVIKQHGALSAKGRLLGVQFDALFTDGLYYEIGTHAVRLAEKLKEVFISKGYTLFIDSPTNQQFVVLDNQKMKELEKEVTFSFWEIYDSSHTVVRFATSWSTTDEDIKALEKIL